MGNEKTMMATGTGARVDVKTQMSHANHTTLCFYDQSVQHLERMIERIPEGWQKLYAEFRVGLRAIRSEKRYGC